MVDQYASARPLFAKAPEHLITDEDKDRVRSYQLQEAIYRSVPATFKLMQYGQDAAPIYLPSAKKMIEATNRYLAVDWNYLVDPASALGTPEEKLQIGQLMSNLWRRERMISKFNSQKRYGLIRGDAVWHVMANPLKVEGRRVSIKEVNPGNYFPILDPEDNEKMIGVHLVDIVKDPREAADPKSKKVVARRQTYLKIESPNGTITITSECNTYETDAWDDRVLLPQDIKKVSVVSPLETLPPQIQAIPVYHIPNKRMPGSIFGDSQIAGLERIFAAVNQSISDEELTLVTQGLGMFYSTSGPPLNADGTTGAWDLGPGQMIEVSPEDKVGRLTGVTSVAPMLDHIKFMLGEAESSIGLSDVATGSVDVTIAESGIALWLKLSPLLASCKEQEQEMLPVYDNMWFDLKTMWFPAFEAFSAESTVEVTTFVGDPMPVNKDAEILRITNMVTAGLMSIDEGRTKLIELGVELDQGTDAAAIIAEAGALAKAKFGDSFANRADTETDDPENAGTGG